MGSRRSSPHRIVHRLEDWPWFRRRLVERSPLNRHRCSASGAKLKIDFTFDLLTLSQKAEMVARLRKSLQNAVRNASTSAQTPPPAFLAQIQAGSISRSRLATHYERTLSHDLLYSLYSHAAHSPATPLPNPLSRSPIWSPDNPYALNRPPPRPKGNRYIVPNPSYTAVDKLVKLESITLESMTKTALANKNNLLPLLMAFQTITGEPMQTLHPTDTTYGPGSGRGLVITKSTKKSASFKIRPGAATGIKITLKGPLMYAFLENLLEFVLPRLKTFGGIKLPSTSHPKQSTSSMGGVVSFGLPFEAIGLFPMMEINLDQYVGMGGASGTRLGGFNVHCLTTAKGRGAQDQARMLLSGFGLPFVKR